MVVNHRESDEYLEQLRLNQIPLGKGVGIKLDENLRFKKASFNIVLGHANVGKTYWILWYLLCHSKVNGLKHLVYSSENTVEGLKRNLIELYSGEKLIGMKPDRLEQCKAFIEDHFDFVDTSKKVFEITEFMKMVQGMGFYDSLVIDPHNSFVPPHGVNTHTYDYEVSSKLRLFAKVTGTSIYMCTHAVTEALRRVHKGKGVDQHPFEGMSIPPSMADAEGGGKWGNRADDFIVIHRYTQSKTDWMTTEVHVKKIKETETGGKPTFLDEPVKLVLHRGTQFSCEGKNPLDEEPAKPAVQTRLQPNEDF